MKIWNAIFSEILFLYNESIIVHPFCQEKLNQSSIFPDLPDEHVDIQYTKALAERLLCALRMQTSGSTQKRGT